ncbi:MAG: DciA family protein [Legionellaceae bacterium]|nr:DciA family protein [Legionellaceae bacterium]
MRHIHDCFNPTLQALCHRAKEMEAWTKLLKTHLPMPLSEYCHVGSFLQGSLTIVLKDPVWATELRYYLPALRDKLRTSGIFQLASIKIKLQEFPVVEKKPKAPPKILPEKTRALIRAGADQVTYAPLREALQKITSE